MDIDESESQPKDEVLDEGEFVEKLQFYYAHLFPAKGFYDWLSYGNVSKDYFERREFSFTLPGDIYLRYQSFRDDKGLKGALVSKVPIKIDIGAVFSGNPRDMKKGLNIATAQERELVFDIDMTDYDEVRTCCKGADLCKLCWPFLAVAAKVLDRALREDFGFKHLLWVYSGRRGVHCWVADERARKLSVDGRNAVGSYLTLISGGQFQSKKCNLDYRKVNLHPSINKALDIINDYFVKLIVVNQKHFDSKQSAIKIANLCTNTALKHKLIAEINSWDAKKKPADKWDRFERTAIGHFNKDPMNKPDRHYIAEVKIQLCYPRLDIAVTKGLNHLLKAPFCVHPKTSRVCIPFDVKKVDSFDPKSVPTLDILQKEIDDYDKDAQASGDAEKIKLPHYQKTQLKASIDLFETFLAKLAKEKKEAEDAKMKAKLAAMDAKMDF